MENSKKVFPHILSAMAGERLVVEGRDTPVRIEIIVHQSPKPLGRVIQATSASVEELELAKAQILGLKKDLHEAYDILGLEQAFHTSTKIKLEEAETKLEETKLEVICLKGLGDRVAELTLENGSLGVGLRESAAKTRLERNEIQAELKKLKTEFKKLKTEFKKLEAKDVRSEAQLKTVRKSRDRLRDMDTSRRKTVLGQAQKVKELKAQNEELKAHVRGLEEEAGESPAGVLRMLANKLDSPT